MKVYIRFLVKLFTKNIFYVSGIFFCLVVIMNLLGELEFFKEINVDSYFPLVLTMLNAPSMMFELFPFIFLIGTQIFFINLFNNNQINIFKYSGLKNSKIFFILGSLSLIFGVFIVILFYNFSSNLKNIYLEFKSPYTTDGKYLAVITKNGLWIKDKINNRNLIINSEKIDENYLIGNFITEFDDNFKSIRNITSKKIDVTDKEWLIYDAKVFFKNEYKFQQELKLKTNFNYKRIMSLYSNLSSLNIYQLYELRENYKKLNYSLTEINLQILKLFSFPLYLLLMTIFSACIMMKIKYLDSSTIKIIVGLFFSVIIYYINNFFYVLGSSERLPLIIAVFLPILILSVANSILIRKINVQ
tara:strand:+ start:980 stop:2053 length:1074 start_codon:yes stop_codon:yes gene_type:complete